MSGSVNDSTDKSSTMDREERIVDIYITAEAVRDIKHKKQTEESKTTTTTQPPEDTGSECVRNRSPRSVLVCLVVLCVLLLTAVIGLCVLIYTNNHQFHINNKNITQVKNQLLANNIKLTEERDELRVNYNNISMQCEQIKQEKNKLLELLQLEGWKYYESSLYYFSSEKKNWSESRRYCEKKGAHLVIINNLGEQDFVGNTSDSLDGIWIGLSDSDDEGRWKWVDGSALNFKSWGGVEPNGGSNENCVETYRSFWNDHYCDLPRKWICKRNIFK